MLRFDGWHCDIRVKALESDAKRDGAHSPARDTLVLTHTEGGAKLHSC